MQGLTTATPRCGGSHQPLQRQRSEPLRVLHAGPSQQVTPHAATSTLALRQHQQHHTPQPQSACSASRRCEQPSPWSSSSLAQRAGAVLCALAVTLDAALPPAALAAAADAPPPPPDQHQEQKHSLLGKLRRFVSGGQKGELQHVWGCGAPPANAPACVASTDTPHAACQVTMPPMLLSLCHHACCRCAAAAAACCAACQC
jgi:hypothetical protein